MRGEYSASISAAASIADSVWPDPMGRTSKGTSTAPFSTRPGVSWPPVT